MAQTINRPTLANNSPDASSMAEPLVQRRRTRDGNTPDSSPDAAPPPIRRLRQRLFDDNTPSPIDAMQELSFNAPQVSTATRRLFPGLAPAPVPAAQPHTYARIQRTAISTDYSNGIANLRGKQLTEIPDNIFRYSIIKLHLDTNQLSTLPEALEELSRYLHTLTLCNNRLTEISAVGKLTHLLVLNLTSNKIKNLPPELCDCSNLEKLELMDNPLEGLPENFGNLKSLQTLSLPKMTLHLPETFVSLEKLTTLYLTEDTKIVLPTNWDSIENVLPEVTKTLIEQHVAAQEDTQENNFINTTRAIFR